MSEKVSGKAFDVKVFRRLMSFAKPYKFRFAIAATSTILLALVAATNPYVLGETVNDFTQTGSIENLNSYMFILLALTLGEVLLQFLYVFYANWVGQHIIRDIRTEVFHRILNFKMAYFDNHAVGRLVTRVVSDIETIAAFFSNGVFTIVSDILKMLVVLVVMFVMNWKLACFAIAVLPVLIYATKIFQIAIKATFQEVRDQVANLNGFVQERVTGIKIVQLFNREKIEYQNFVSINEKHKKAYIKTIWYYSIFFPIAEILSSVALGLIVWYGGRQALQGFADVGAIIMFIKMSQMLFRPLRQIADKFNQLQMGIVSGERVFKVMDTVSFSFRNVRFSYVPNEEVLKGISFDVQQGQTVAIVGATGAGKSTIINLINRFYEIDKGVISVDGVLIKDYALASLRNEIAVVLQDVFLFSDTIYNNITLKDESITLEEVKAAAKNIGIHDFVMSLPQNYHYNVKERGVMLSSGQRQLIAFLRAYVSNPSILILDEATSSVDSHSEQMIQYATDTITKDRTSIVIAHRLATIKKADMIIVMDKGEIVEQGTHKELLKKQDGYYRNLYDKQFSLDLAS